MYKDYCYKMHTKNIGVFLILVHLHNLIIINHNNIYNNTKFKIQNSINIK